MFLTIDILLVETKQHGNYHGSKDCDYDGRNILLSRLCPLPEVLHQDTLRLLPYYVIDMQDEIIHQPI